MPEVAVIILVYNSVSKLGNFFFKAVNSVLKQDGDFKIVFVDNGSTDNTPEVLTHICTSSNKPCSVLYLNRNYGWSYANNRGALLAKDSKYFLFLNDDMILSSNTLKKLVNFIESNNHVGALQPVIKNKDGSVFYGFDVGIGGMCKPIIKPRGYPFSEAFYVSGAALLTPSKLFFRVGMFPEKFFLYYDDVDYCWRIRRLGYKVGTLVTDHVYHYGSATLGERSPQYLYYDSRNRVWGIYRNTPRHILLLSLSLTVVENFIAYTLHEAIIRRDWIRTIAALKGLTHGFLKRFDNSNNFNGEFSIEAKFIDPRIDVEVLIPRSLFRIVRRVFRLDTRLKGEGY